MKITRWLLVVLLGCSMMGSFSAPARAADSVPVADGESFTPPDDADHWWGVAGAVLCGAEGYLIRTNPALGMNAGCLAAGIAGCILMLIDH
jgi:hypothetical protein